MIVGCISSAPWDARSSAFFDVAAVVVVPHISDAAFKEYANRWKYKHPNPADFFRSLEDGTAVDLDWFFKGWFFTTDVIDIELADVKWFRMKEEEASVERTKLKGKSTKIY